MNASVVPTNTTAEGDMECGSIPVMKWSLRLIHCLILVVGLVGNTVVCTAIMRRKRMRTSINLFTFNLAFSDLIIIVIYVPSQMVAQENCQNWVLGNFMCHVVYLVLPVCVSTSIGSLLTISCDRYRAIVYPMKPKLSPTTVKTIIALIWFLSALTALPLALVVEMYSPGPNLNYCTEIWPQNSSWSLVYWVTIFIIQYAIPIVIIATQAVVITLKLRKSKVPMIGTTSDNTYKTALRRRIKQTRKITKMMIALVLLYAICLLPQHVVATFWLSFGNLMELSNHTRSIIYEVVNVFPIANSALNAIAYGTLNKEFKNIFKGTFNVRCRSAGDPGSKLHAEGQDTRCIKGSRAAFTSLDGTSKMGLR